MRLILFDVDGTLVDSQNEIVEAQARAFAANGLPAPTREQAISVVGLSLTEAFAVLAGPLGPIDGLAEAYVAAWTEIRQRPAFLDMLYPGVKALIDSLAVEPGTILGIATGKSRRGVDRILKAQDWVSVFATIQTADTHPSKPDPSMILAAMAETGARAAETLMIGDTTYDMEMAVAAGARPVGVAWGYHDASALTAARAIVVADDIAALRTTLTNLAEEAA